MKKKSYYEVLQVSPDASEEEIKHAYHQLAIKHHPDSANEERSEELFQEISEANAVLSDPSKRELYDLTQRTMKEERRGFAEYKEQKIQSAYRETAEDQAKRERVNKKVETQKISSTFLSKLVGQIMPFFSAVKEKSATFRSSAIGQIEARKLSQTLRGDRKYQFKIDALESIKGTYRELGIRTDKGPKIIRIKIPAGIEDGGIIFTRTGEGAETKEIAVKVNIESHKFVERNDNNIIFKLPLTIGEAVLGTGIEIPTPDGPVRIKIPPGAGTNQKLRLKGKGIKGKDDSRGDIYVKTYILPPDTLNDTVKQAATALDQNYITPVRAEFPKKL